MSVSGDGPVAVVTGGARRLGRHLCSTLAARGFDLVVLYRTAEADAQSLTAAIEARGRHARALPVDVALEADVASVFRDIRATEGRLDLLVNNVGNYNPQHVTKLDPTAWDATLAANLSGAFYCCYHALPFMSDNGNIINVGMAGLEGIRANVICPGTINTPRGGAYWDQKAGAKDKLLKWYPLGRLGEPEDIASLAVYLASDESSFMTGSTLVIDGGLTAGTTLFGNV